MLVEIIPNLFIGDIASAENMSANKSLDLIVNCSTSIPFFMDSDIQRYRLHYDESTLELHKLWNEVYKIRSMFPEIKSHISCGKIVLIHCNTGSQLSPTIAACFLIYMFRMDVEHVIRYFRRKHKMIWSGKVKFLEVIDCFYKNHKHKNKVSE